MKDPNQWVVRPSAVSDAKVLSVLFTGLCDLQLCLMPRC